MDLKLDCNPFATSDVCVFPFPSAFFQRENPGSPTGVRMNCPQSVFWVDQAIHFLINGEIAQTCTGSCDPD